VNDTLLVTPKEAARLLSISKAGLYRALNTPGFPQPIRIGPKTVRFRRTDLVAWVNRPAEAA